MKKLEYKQPRIDVDVLNSKISLMAPLQPTGSGLEPAPKRRGDVIE